MRGRILGVLLAGLLATGLTGCASGGTGAVEGTGAAGGTGAPASQVSTTGSASASAPGSGAADDTSGPARTTNTPPQSTVSERPTTIVVTPTAPTLVPPPPTTAEPRPTSGTCPYLSAMEVRDANGQNVGRTAIVDVQPYPICLFYRPDGTVMAATRIIEAASPEEAAAAVNQHVPIADSFEVTKPAGWSGGAMPTPDGVPGYPDARSIYAVSKGTIAVIALSNQAQSIKGRQMATDIIMNLGL